MPVHWLALLQPPRYIEFPSSLLSYYLIHCSWPCSARVREVKRSMLLRISSALLVHTKAWVLVVNGVNSAITAPSSRTL